MACEPPPGFRRYDDPGPFLELVGPVYARDDGGEPVFGLRVEEHHRNRAGAAHGGLLAALVDFALGRAVGASTEEDARAVTVSLTTHFLGPANAGEWLEASTEVEQVGGTLAFADCSVHADGREVVRGRAVFAVRG